MGQWKRQGDDFAELRRTVKELLHHGAGSYALLAPRARDVKSAVLAELAENLAPALNAEIGSRPQDTLEEQRELAGWVNHELRVLGLAIRFPQSTAPGIVTANPKYSGDEPCGQFRIENKSSPGVRQRSTPTIGMPTLELIEDSPRREGGSRFR